jgi:4-hydroxy-tetrahydrodipicolinate synthase
MQGIYTALVTPFTELGDIDYNALKRVLDQQVSAGIKGFVVSGTTGESPTLSKEEKKSLFQYVFDYSKNKALDLVAGTGTNDTRESVILTELAAGIGYRKFLTVVPYYNKPSQAGLYAHFIKIADAVEKVTSDGIVILYNVPGRSGISLSIETIVSLATHPRIRAIKEASGDLKFLEELISGLKTSGKTLSLLSGDDATYFPFIRRGGHGVISVSSHVCPRGMLEIEAAVRDGNLGYGEELQKKYLPLFQNLFIEANPCPLKWMLKKLNLSENHFRLPLVPVSKETEKKLESTVAAYEVEKNEYR